MLSQPGHYLSGLDLEAVTMPERPTEMNVADQFDSEAEYYLRMRTDLGVLAAAVILRRADEIDRFGSASLREYFAELDRREDAAIEEPAGDPFGVQW